MRSITLDGDMYDSSDGDAVGARAGAKCGGRACGADGGGALGVGAGVWGFAGEQSDQKGSSGSLLSAVQWGVTECLMLVGTLLVVLL